MSKTMKIMTVFLVKTIAAFPHILLKREKFVKIFYSFVCRFFLFPFPFVAT
jgi:hypothetical protein